MSSMIDGPASYRLYPIFRRNPLRAASSAGPSTPFGDLPSITPITPRPCSVFATITSTGLAVAQKIEHTSGMFCTTFNRFMGYASRRMRTKTCPAPKAWALAMAAFRSSSSLPSARVRHGPEDSLKASPNLACGTDFTTGSYMSSAVLMKCVWPTIMLVSSGNFIRTDSSSIMASFQRAGELRISFYRSRKRQLMPVRVTDVEIPFAPRSIPRLFRLESKFVEASPERVHIRDMEDEPTPAVDRLTLLQIENGRLCLPCAK